MKYVQKLKKSERLAMFYEKTTLGNGLTVITERMPDVRSVSLGIWFNVGSRDERADQAGLTHFMEHMMFKGTPTRSALEISQQFDSLGAELNAFTSKEYTCYYARFVDDKLDRALEMLADMVNNSSFSQETIDPEREVVLEEIARSEDTPDDKIYDVLSDAMLPTHPLGRPVLGTRELVAGYKHANCAAFHDEHYYSGNIVVSAAGNVDHDRLVQLCDTLFADAKVGTKASREKTVEGDRQMFACMRKETEQAHVLVGLPWMPFDDERRFAGAVMSAMLGGSMSSRLFQEVREKRGLVYAIYSHAEAHQGLGTFSVYAGTRPENIEEVVSIATAEMQKMAEGGTDAAELSRTTESLVGQLLLGLESTATRMVRMGRTQTMGGPLLSADELVERYRAITCEDVRDIASQILTQKPTVAVISPYDEDKVLESLTKAFKANGKDFQ